MDSSSAHRLLLLDLVCPRSSLHGRPDGFKLLSCQAWLGFNRIFGTRKRWEFGFICNHWSGRRGSVFACCRSRLLKDIVGLPTIPPWSARVGPSPPTSSTASSTAMVIAIASMVVSRVIIRAVVIEVSSSISRNPTMHPAPETTLPASGVIVFFLLGSVPLPSVQGVELPLAVTLSFRVHHTTMLALLTTFLFGHFFAFEE